MVMVCQKIQNANDDSVTVYIVRTRTLLKSPLFWLVLFPGFWLVDRYWILSSHWSDFLAGDCLVIWSDRKFSKLKTLYRWCSLVSWCCHWSPALSLVCFPAIWLDNRLEMVTSDWSNFLAADWFMMEHISILLPPDYRLSRCHSLDLVFSTIGLCEHIQYIQSICIHYAVFKHSWYDSVVYCYTIHLEMNSSHIHIYIYSKVFNNQNWKSECSDLYFFPGIIRIFICRFGVMLLQKETFVLLIFKENYCMSNPLNNISCHLLSFHLKVLPIHIILWHYSG